MIKAELIQESGREGGGVSELPDSWIESSFRDVCGSGQYGWTTKASASGYVKFLRTTDITKGQISWTSVPFCQDVPGDIDKYIIHENDILVSRAGSVGFSTLIATPPQRTVFASYLIRFVPVGSVAPRYVAHFLKSPEYWQQIVQASAGIALANVNASKLGEVQIPLAPLNEQKRIADKLDSLLKRVDSCRERLDRVPLILKRFRQSVLAAATSGSLTEDWRSSAELIRWKTTIVQKIASDIFDGPFGSHLKSNDYTETGIRVVRLENIGWLNFNLEKDTFISPEKYQTLKKHTLKFNDVLFSSFISEDVRVCLLPEVLSGSTINKADCFCIRTNANCLPKFLAMRLASRSTFTAFAEDIHGATRPRINLGQLKAFTFELPPLPEQHEIVRRVEKLFAFADRIEARYTVARSQVETLTPSLLAKAFRGELVEQDPTDEPAAVLLARIRAQKESEPSNPGKRTAKTSKPPVESVSGSEPATLASKGTETSAPIPHPTSPLKVEAKTSTSAVNIPLALLKAMKPGHEYSRADLTTATGITDADWIWAIRQLRESGQVVQVGERRGARYRRKE